MGKVFDAIDDKLAAWIGRQHMFFVGTAPSGDGGHVNVSPKGPIESLRILDPHTVAYLDVIGSGAETAAHLQENGRIVVMLCAFDGPPRILRLHGRGEVIWAEDARFEPLRAALAFDEPEVDVTRRAIVRVDVTRIADACGFGVPLMDYVDSRANATKWAEGKLRKDGPQAMDIYKTVKNTTSIDGLPAWPGAEDPAPA